MYKDLSLQELVKEAEHAISLHRGVLFTAYIAAEIFANKHELMLGGSAGLAGIFQEPLGVPDYIWSFYCARPYQIAKEFSENLFYLGVKNVCVHTYIRGQELSVTIDGIPYFRFHRMSLQAKPGPSISGWFTGVNILTIPIEFALAKIYQSLYDPSLCLEWPKLLATEAKIFAMLDAKKINNGPFTNESLIHFAPVKNSIHAIIALALSGILVGFTTNSTDIISETKPAKIKHILEKIFRETKKTKSPNFIASKSRELGIPGDFRLSRDEYWPTRGRQHKVHVYNSTSYECIPGILDEASGVIVSSTWVRLRFQCLYSKISQRDRDDILGGSAKDAFPQDLYFGTPELPAVSRKKITAEDQFTPDYCPSVGIRPK